MTLKEIYRQSIKKSNDLDARVLICHCLNISTEKFFLMQNDEISKAQIEKIESIIKQRANNIPVAYLTGHKEFFGLDFAVNKNVLIPRPETEWIVGKSIKFIKSKVHKVIVLDVGTGSGNIIISLILSLRAQRCHSELAKNLDVLFFASDISAAALKVAQKNAVIHKVDDKIKFIQSDLFENLKNKKFDIIIANLPYVPRCHSGLEPESSIYFEPPAAIFADDNGAEIIKRFLKSAPDYLNNNGAILLELDPRNALDIKKFATEIFPKAKIILSKDLSDFDRYLTISN